jgi:hypothetical protein
LPRLRAETCRYGVQARTFQVLAMTGWENGFFFYIGIWVTHHP